MTVYGYARTSTFEQVAGLADQIAKLREAGCTDQSIYLEQINSVKMEDRVEFVKVLAGLKIGVGVRSAIQTRPECYWIGSLACA